MAPPSTRFPSVSIQHRAAFLSSSVGANSIRRSIDCVSFRCPPRRGTLRPLGLAIVLQGFSALSPSTLPGSDRTGVQCSNVADSGLGIFGARGRRGDMLLLTSGYRSSGGRSRLCIHSSVDKGFSNVTDVDRKVAGPSSPKTGLRTSAENVAALPKPALSPASKSYQAKTELLATALWQKGWRSFWLQALLSALSAAALTLSALMQVSPS